MLRPKRDNQILGQVIPAHLPTRAQADRDNVIHLADGNGQPEVSSHVWIFAYTWTALGPNVASVNLPQVGGQAD